MQWSRNVVHTSLVARMSSMHYSKNLQDGMRRAKLTVNNLAVFGTISGYSFTVHGYCLPRKDS